MADCQKRSKRCLADDPACDAAACGADALTAAAWSGPANYDDTAKFSAVVRDWERRFGARVVGVGFDTLHLSVAGPSLQAQDALLVAADHFAFCPDNVWQGSSPPTLAVYAERIVGNLGRVCPAGDRSQRCPVHSGYEPRHAVLPAWLRR
ncbi:DUF4253 domain-containing protein [Streptomyces aculeolatus]